MDIQITSTTKEGNQKACYKAITTKQKQQSYDKEYGQEMIVRRGMYWDIFLQANGNRTG